MLPTFMAGRIRTPGPEQLTLEDWAQTQAASVDEQTMPTSEVTSVDDPTAGRQADARVARQLPAKELLETPGALLTRTHLRELGLERRAIDAVFRKLPVVALPGYSRPLVHAEEYLHLIDEHTYRDDRVRPLHA
jgi:hypothetical protein